MNMNRMKRILSLVLAVILLLSNIPAVVFAAEETADEVATEPTAAVTEPFAEETMAPTQPPVPEETAAPTETVTLPTEVGTEPVEETAPAETSPDEESEVLLSVSGSCGENLFWSLDDGVLTITGEGPMGEFETQEAAPWYEVRSEILAVIIGEGVTTIADYAFYHCDHLERIEIPESVTAIADNAFACCDNLKDVQFGGSREQWDEIFAGSEAILCGTITTRFALSAASEEEKIPEAGISDGFINAIEQITTVEDIPEGYTPIYDENDLKAIANNRSGKYILMRDVVFESRWGLCSKKKPFTGVLDGNGHTISGLCGTEWSSTGMRWGLFEAIDGAHISNLKVSGFFKVESMGYANDLVLLGALAGEATGNIQIINCVGDVTFYSSTTSNSTVIYTGGLIGQYTGSADDALISGCRNFGTIAAVRASGGIVGYCSLANSELRIESCYNEADLSCAKWVSGDDIGGQVGSFGGILGCVTGKSSSVFIACCANNGEISVGAAGGGIMGQATGKVDLTIASCINTGAITGNINVGGIAGNLMNHHVVQDCLNTGAIKMNNATYHAGGIAASEGKFYCCLNLGTVRTPAVKGQSFNSAIVNKPGSTTEAEAEAAVVDCYWLDNGQTNTLYALYDYGTFDSKVIRTRGKLTKEQLREEENFSGFNFESVWLMHKLLGHPVPVGVTIHVEPNLEELLNNQDIQINSAGDAYAFYQGDPDTTYSLRVNGQGATVDSDEDGVIRVKLGSFQKYGVFDFKVEFTHIDGFMLNKPKVFTAKVLVTPLEFTQNWSVSLDAGVAKSIGGVGGKLEIPGLGTFKGRATLGSLTSGAGVGHSMNVSRSFADGTETLELTSNYSIKGKVGVESGITGEILKNDVDIVKASAGIDAAGTVLYGIRLSDYDQNNRGQQKAIATYLLGESLKMAPNYLILKSFYKQMAKEAYKASGVDEITGNGAVASGQVEAGVASLELNDVAVFSGLKTATQASLALDQVFYENGEEKYTAAYSTSQNLHLLSAAVVEGVIGVDYLGKDISLEIKKDQNGEESLETTSLSAGAMGINSFIVGQNYTAKFNRFLFQGDALEALTKNSSVLKAYVDGSGFTVGNAELSYIAKNLSGDVIPVAYSEVEKSQKVNTLSLGIGVELGVGVEFDTSLSYLEAVDHTTARGYAVDDVIRENSKSVDLSAQVAAESAELADIFLHVTRSLAEEAADFFEKTTGAIADGVSNIWARISGKAKHAGNGIVTMTCPGGESAWMDFSVVAIAGSKQAITVGRPFYISVKDGTTDEPITDLRADPLLFTIRYTKEELQASGLPVGKVAMYRYEADGDYFFCVGGVHDSAEMTVTAEITKPGQYVLAMSMHDDTQEGTTQAPVTSIWLDKETVILNVNETAQLTAQTNPAELVESVRWTTDKDTVIRVEQDGTVTAVGAGTAYVIATVHDGEKDLTARCRVDVRENTQLLGAQLDSSKVNLELYKNEFATFEILLDLPQNHPVDTLMISNSAANAGAKQSNVVDSVAFKTISDLFELVMLDDRTVQIVPTQKALDTGKTVKSSYTDAVIVTIQGKEYPIAEKLTLTVKKTLPKLKATVAEFNSFYDGQSRMIAVSGGTATKIYRDEAADTEKTPAIPAWLKLDTEGMGILTLAADAPAKNASGKAYILVETQEWRIPVAVTLNVKNSHKVPTLNLPATSVSLNSLNGDKKEIVVTSSFADYVPDELDITSTAGDALTIEKEGNRFTVSTNEKTAHNKTYKITVKTANPKIKAVTLTVKTVGKAPTMNSLKLKGTLDVTFPANKLTIGVTLKDYADAFEPTLTIKDSKGNDVTDQFTTNWNGTEFEVAPNGIAKGTYTASVTALSLEKTAKLTVKETLPKINLSATKVTLNKNLNSSVEIDITSATKGYELKSLAHVEAPAQVKAVPENGKLTVSLNESAEYGKTYKVTVSAYKGAPAVSLSIAVPKKDKSDVSATIKAAGFIDVIRGESAITITPTFVNAYASDMESMELKFYKRNGKVWEDVTEAKYFHAENVDGKFIVTAEENLTSSDKYQAELVYKIGGKELKSKQIALTIKMGSAKVTIKSSETTMFAKDRNDRALVWFEATDLTLNDVAKIEIKDAKYRDAFTIIDYEDGTFGLAFKDGKIHKEIEKLIAKKASSTITLNLNVFIDGNTTTKANVTQKVTLTIVK